MYKSCLIGKCWIEEFHSRSGMWGFCIDRPVLVDEFTGLLIQDVLYTR